MDCIYVVKNCDECIKEGTCLKLSVIIPTIDEYEDVKTVVSQIYDACRHGDIAEIMLIHNSDSTDNYIAYLRSLQLFFPEIPLKVVRQNRPGIGAAVYEGFYASTGDYVTAIGADLENDPRDIAEMITMAEQHPGAVITASRRLRRGDFKEYPPVKRFFNIAFQTALHILIRTKQSDITYMYQCTPKELLYRYDFSDSVNTFILALALLPEMYDIPFYEIPSKVATRQHGKSHLSVQYYAGFIREVLRLIRKHGKR